MNRRELKKALAALPLGGVRYYASIGSTNDEALTWAAQSAPDLSLVIANEQTRARGRGGRTWITPPNCALAFSLILRPTEAERTYPARMTALGALALVECLKRRGLQAHIKWPNDVLLNGRKVAGILVEAVWMGNVPDAFVLGMGVNVLASSVPPDEQLLFPATSIESECGQAVDRAELLKEILASLIAWRSKIGQDEFLRAWEQALAFRGEWVEILRDDQPPLRGKVLGLEVDGSLRLKTEHGCALVPFGEIHLRPAV